jgi:hypothetical protein
MSVVKGRICGGLNAPGISGLVHHLTARGTLQLQLVDNDRNVVAESGTCPAAGAVHCAKLRERLAAELLETRQPCCEVCPAGAHVAVLPIMHSSAFFGGIVVCELQAGASQHTHEEESGRQVISRPSEEIGGETVTMVDPLVNSLSSIVAQNSFYELEVESLSSDLALRYEELALMYEIGERIPIRAQTSSVLSYVVDSFRSVIRCEAVCWVPSHAGLDSPADSEAISYADDHRGSETGVSRQISVYWTAAERRDEGLEGHMKRISSEVGRRVKEKGETVTINDTRAEAPLCRDAPAVSAVSGYPLSVETEYYGTLVLFKLGSGEFKSGEAMLVTAVMRRSGTVIRNAKLYQELNTLFLSTIKALVRLIEGKDAYTRGHSERVNTFSGLLADLLSLPLQDKEALTWSSLLHDIGKIKVPEEILKKPGSLTDEEFAVIQKHPGFGAEMLSPIRQLGHCLPDIRHHHERIDGRGYPDHLSGDEIPLRARIIAVADTFDALTSDRCYRPRFGAERALEIVEQAAGTQLYTEAAHALVVNKHAFLEHVETQNNLKESKVKDDGS